MRAITILVLLLFCFQQAIFTDPPCEMELQCAECLPDNMPLVTSHDAADGRIRAAPGDELRLSCGEGKFLLYPARNELRAVCEAGRYRVRDDNQLRPLLDLGCQESVFEDVLHQVAGCAAPLQGRAYVVRAGARHVGAACFDADAGVARRLRMSAAPGNRLDLPPHAHAAAPLSLLGNFNHMFDAKTRHDAEKLYSDDARMNRRLRELFKHEPYSFADQTLTSAKLLSESYFEDQNMRATDFVSNRVAVWKSVAEGNLRHLQRDVSEFVRRARALPRVEVHAGAHGVLSLRGAGGRGALFLRAAGRFPVPRYVWTVLHAPAARRAVALVLLNDPFVAVSEIRDAVFCDSACGQLQWLHELRRARRYEVPVYGLVFCCSLRNFTSVVPEMLQDLDVPPGPEGMLTQLVV